MRRVLLESELDADRRERDALVLDHLPERRRGGDRRRVAALAETLREHEHREQVAHEPRVVKTMRAIACRAVVPATACAVSGTAANRVESAAAPGWGTVRACDARGAVRASRDRDLRRAVGDRRMAVALCAISRLYRDRDVVTVAVGVLPDELAPYRDVVADWAGSTGARVMVVPQQYADIRRALAAESAAGDGTLDLVELDDALARARGRGRARASTPQRWPTWWRRSIPRRCAPARSTGCASCRIA